MKTAPQPRPRSWLARNVVLLGAVSLANDVASEMIIPLLPIFLTTHLGAGALVLGWIEGLADAVASTLKLVVGRWSDRLRRRRPLVLAGYATSAAVRPLMALAAAPWHVLAVRVTDRVGKGVRTSPRDALIAGSVSPEERGEAFGLNRAMDHAGAVLGPLVAAGYLAFVSKNLRMLFVLTAVPGAIAVLMVAAGVKEVPHAPGGEAAGAARDRQPRGGRIVRLLVPLGLFTVGNASDTFLLLKAGAERAPLTTLPLLWMALHLVKSTTSVPGGWLADRWGKTKTIVLGWLYYSGVYTGFAFAESHTAIWLLFVAYGLYHGLTEGAERALVTALVPSRRLGTGFGWFHLVVGVLTLAASVLFGLLWEAYGSRVAFLTGAGLALLGAATLVVLRPERAREDTR